MSYLVSVQVPGDLPDGELRIYEDVTDAVIDFSVAVFFLSGHRPDPEDILGFVEAGLPCYYVNDTEDLMTSIEKC